MTKRKHNGDRHLRVMVWIRDKQRCRWCGDHVPFGEMHLAHGHSIHFKGIDEVDNFYCSCKDCNSDMREYSIPPGSIPLEEVKIVNEVKITFAERLAELTKTKLNTGDWIPPESAKTEVELPHPTLQEVEEERRQKTERLPPRRHDWQYSTIAMAWETSR